LGIDARSRKGYAIYADAQEGGTSIYAVGRGTGTGVSVVKLGTAGYAVRGDARESVAQAVSGVARSTNVTAYGVYGEAPSSGKAGPNQTFGVYGYATSTFPRGVLGAAHSSRTSKNHWCSGVYGYTTTTRGYGVFAYGDFGGTGAKHFVQPDPSDPERSIQFVCLEGNENGTYFRGQTRLVKGRAEIAIPEEWRLVSERDGITVQVTPIRSFARLTAWEVSRDRIEIRGDEDCEFAYFVNGVRRGFADYEKFVPNSAFKPEIRGVPFASALPDALRDVLVRNGILNPDYTPNEATAKRLGWKLKDPSDVPVNQRWWLSDTERARPSRAEDSIGLPESR